MPTWAELYGVTTTRLNEQVKRNAKRFPKDFMFQLNEEEFEILMSQIATSRGGRRKLPYIFTEHRAVMLASVINSERAIEVNIQIVRIFTQLRQVLATNQDILLKLQSLESNMSTNSKEIQYIFQVLKQLLEPEIENVPRRSIGYKTANGD